RVFLARAADEPGYASYAQEQFQALVKADPQDEDAAVGLATALDSTGDADGAAAAIEALLAKKPGSAPGLEAKGSILYRRAEQGVRAGVSPEVRALFEKAADLFEASTKSDPLRQSAWMDLAHACHYLVSV